MQPGRPGHDVKLLTFHTSFLIVAMYFNFRILSSALLKATFLLGLSSLFLSQAGWASWYVENHEDGKVAYSAETTSKNDKDISAEISVQLIDDDLGCATFIDVYGDVEFQEKDWFKYRFDAEVDRKKIIISGEPLNDGGFYIFNGSSGRRATERDWPRIEKRERTKTIKLLKEHNEFVIRLPLKDRSPVFAISLEGADDAIKEVCL